MFRFCSDLSRLFMILLLGILSWSQAATAGESPKVVVSIKPIHSIATYLMKGIATPALIMETGSTPHDFTLKPSSAAQIQNADMIIWVGQGLESFMVSPIKNLALNAESIELMQTPGLKLLPFRTFDQEEDDHHGESHKDHSEHDKGHSSHDDAHGDHSGTNDPHVWLDPENVKLIAKHIADKLGTQDPDRAETYQANLTQFILETDDLSAQLNARLASFKNSSFMVMHDAYHYFEDRFGIETRGSIFVNPESQPGAAQIRKVQEKLKELKVTCIFSEPQFNPAVINLVSEGLEIRTTNLDPIGMNLASGPQLYFDLMRSLVKSFENCLS